MGKERPMNTWVHSVWKCPSLEEKEQTSCYMQAEVNGSEFNLTNRSGEEKGLVGHREEGNIGFLLRSKVLVSEEDGAGDEGWQ